jgi:hypothetical protein
MGLGIYFTIMFFISLFLLTQLILMLCFILFGFSSWLFSCLHLSHFCPCTWSVSLNDHYAVESASIQMKIYFSYDYSFFLLVNIAFEIISSTFLNYNQCRRRAISVSLVSILGARGLELGFDSHEKQGFSFPPYRSDSPGAHPISVLGPRN